MNKKKDNKKNFNDSSSKRSNMSSRKSSAKNVVKNIAKKSVTNKPGIRVAFGLFFTFFAIFTLITLVSYMFTWAEDQSLLSNSSAINKVIDVSNWGGNLGFLWSNFLVSKLFGLGAFVVLFFLIGLSIYCFHYKKINIVKIFFVSIFGCIIFSMFFAFVFSLTNIDPLFGQGAGGSYGYALNNWFISMLGYVGTACLVIFLVVLWSIILSRKVGIWLSDRFSALFTAKPKDQLKDDENSENEDLEGYEKEGEDDSEVGNEDDEDDDDDGNDDDENEDEDEDGKNNDIDNDVEFVIEENKPENHADNEFDTKDDEDENSDEECLDNSEADFNANNADNTDNKNTEDEIPELEIVDGDYSKVLNDRQWKQRYDPRLSLSNYHKPPISLLKESTGNLVVPKDELENNNKKIVTTLKNYRIAISKISARTGPTVTLYEVVPAPGVRVSQIKRLEEDIALSLAAKGVRVVNLPGTNTIGIEVANENPCIVNASSVIGDPKFANDTKMALPIAIGKTISNEVKMFDLTKMPHLLVAGATGQGKSVGLNMILASLLYKKHPAELKFVLVDPKKVEFSLYNSIKKHYLAMLPDSDEAIITDTDRVVPTLLSLCKLMDYRYDLLKAAHVRNIKEYNEKFLSRRLNPNKGHEFMPYIVVVIDEFSDLIITQGREVEEPITRLAQLARAIGIHLVIATQRPTTNIITGTIKANFPARIAFRVMSGIDSKTILDQTGANSLVGRGDMLLSTGSEEPVRVQCAFIDTPEVEALAEYISKQQSFGSPYLLPEYEMASASLSSSGSFNQDRDVLFEEAARLIVSEQQGSASMLQRKLSLGYNRAGRIIDQLEEIGVVGPSEGSKAREVRIASIELLEQKLQSLR
ncbi:MAG: DNA translocase FtsK [Bacteroidales bacterium]